MSTKPDSDVRNAQWLKETTEFQKKLLDAGVWRSCMNCIDFDRNKAYCCLHKGYPPLETIMHSCIKWEREVPF